MKFTYGVVVPCYNVGKACLPVLRSAASQVYFCVAVDDGSSDETQDCIRNLDLPNLRIIRHEKNLGKGTALLSGFRFVLQEEPSVAAVLTLDADGQHDPSLIPLFLEEFEKVDVDLVYGNRMVQQGKIPIHRRFLNQLSNRLMSRICRQVIVDSQCGFRLYSKKLLTELLNEVRTGQYELETEILILACRRNFRIRNVPVGTVYSRDAKRLSHHGFYHVLRIGHLMVSHLVFHKKR